jgi:probable HAF family extracellular repeat protein
MWLTRTFMLLLVGAWAYSPVHAVQYAITDLGEGFFPIAMNNVGQVVGERNNAVSHRSEPWLYDNGAMRPLDDGAGYEILVRGINDRGQVVGSRENPAESLHASLWDPAEGWISLEPPGVPSSFAADINNHGAVAIQLYDVSGMRQPSGVVIPLGDLGSGYADAVALSDAGHVVGFAGTADQSAHHAFIWRDGVMRDLNVAAHVPEGVTDFECAYDVNNAGLAVGVALVYPPNADPLSYGFLASTDAVTVLPGVTLLAVNDRGQAVGSMSVPESLPIGADAWTVVLYDQGAVFDLNELIATDSQFTITGAMDINQAGQIAVTGVLKSRTSEDLFHGLLLTPVAEPLSSWLGLTAIALIAGISRTVRSVARSGRQLLPGPAQCAQ